MPKTQKISKDKERSFDFKRFKNMYAVSDYPLHEAFCSGALSEERVKGIDVAYRETKVPDLRKPHLFVSLASSNTYRCRITVLHEDVRQELLKVPPHKTQSCRRTPKRGDRNKLLLQSKIETRQAHLVPRSSKPFNRVIESSPTFRLCHSELSFGTF
jgi:hypothetical protein